MIEPLIAKANAPGIALIPDCGGSISRIAMALPRSCFTPECHQQLKCLSHFPKSLSSSATLVILTEQGSALEVSSWIKSLNLICKHEILPLIPDGASTRETIWIQDKLLCGDVHGEPTHILPTILDGGSHGQWLDQHGVIATTSATIHLEGGNCLVGPDYWIVGANSVWHTAKLFTRSNEAAARAAIQSLDRRPLYIAGYHAFDIADISFWSREDAVGYTQQKSLDSEGNANDGRLYSIGSAPARETISTPKNRVPDSISRGRLYQPWFHIDMMISVTGKSIESKPILVVADPLNSPIIRGLRDRVHAPRLDAMAFGLEADGFHVIRNPVPVLPLPGSSGSMPRAYNNVIVQNYPPIVWLPQFADLEPELNDIEAANRQIWTDLGFDVMGLPGWSVFAHTRGAIRCCTKILGRHPKPILLS